MTYRWRTLPTTTRTACSCPIPGRIRLGGDGCISMRHWTASITAAWANPWLRGLGLLLYYLAILLGLLVLYGRGDFSTPPFVYQGY